ncbi:MAG: LPXTG cell wall anchor domain-containing protein, partial [Planctomycetota bacterium]
LFTIDATAEDAELAFGLHPLVLAFDATDDDTTDIPDPASAWAGLGTLALLGGIAWKKRRRLA